MKEATGEASMTVVVIVVIGVVAAAAAIIIPSLMHNISDKADSVNNISIGYVEAGGDY